MMPKEALNVIPRKQKSRRALISQLQGVDCMRGVQELPLSLPFNSAKKASKKSSNNEGSPVFQKKERTTASGFLETSTYASDYGALRRKYWVLKEESFTLGKKLREVENEIKTIEEEKLVLLDQLVVLEGLV
ncbi:hypothetical protein Ancab_026719 [Ancistrocladus abbreviatus]